MRKTIVAVTLGLLFAQGGVGGAAGGAVTAKKGNKTKAALGGGLGAAGGSLLGDKLGGSTGAAIGAGVGGAAGGALGNHLGKKKH